MGALRIGDTVAYEDGVYVVTEVYEWGGGIMCEPLSFVKEQIAKWRHIEECLNRREAGDDDPQTPSSSDAGLM